FAFSGTTTRPGDADRVVRRCAPTVTLRIIDLDALAAAGAGAAVTATHDVELAVHPRGRGGKLEPFSVAGELRSGRKGVVRRIVVVELRVGRPGKSGPVVGITLGDVDLAARSRTYRGLHAAGDREVRNWRTAVGRRIVDIVVGN